MQLRRNSESTFSAAASTAHAARFVRLLGAIVFMFAIPLGDGDAFAKHRKALVSSDPCVSMTAKTQRLVGQMKGINKAIASEQSAPTTLAGVFQRMQGKAFVDQTKADQLARLRKDADGLQGVMRLAGCSPIDIDAELKKPSIARVR